MHTNLKDLIDLINLSDEQCIYGYLPNNIHSKSKFYQVE